jgi:hypothetical protein
MPLKLFTYGVKISPLVNLSYKQQVFNSCIVVQEGPNKGQHLEVVKRYLALDKISKVSWTVFLFHLLLEKSICHL